MTVPPSMQCLFLRAMVDVQAAQVVLDWLEHKLHRRPFAVHLVLSSVRGLVAVTDGGVAGGDRFPIDAWALTEKDPHGVWDIGWFTEEYAHHIAKMLLPGSSYPPWGAVTVTIKRSA